MPGGSQLRRIVFYLFFDPQGVVDDYVTYKLQALREHADHIFVVSNSPLTPQGRDKLESVADTVWARRNVGFDVWAYKEAMETFGMDRLAEFDELILMNYTFFGPIFPFAETFKRLDAQELDFWGLTAHKEVDPNPFAGSTGVLPLHIQSHWIAVRKAMFTSLEFQQYWATMPMITSYDGSVLNHEARFTQHFASKGFTYAIAFPPEDYPSDNPVFDNAVLMLDNRCPILKRRMFFHEPSYLERNAILGRRVLQRLEETDYPTDLIWANVVRSAEPRTLHTNFSMLSVLPDGNVGQMPEPAPRICVIAHIYYDEMVEEMMSYVGHIPGSYDLVVTTDTEAKRLRILEALGHYDIARVEVRVLESNRGRETSAFLVGCQDLLTPGRYDLICKVHSKKSAQDGYNLGMLFKHHMFDNLLSSPLYVSHLLSLFAKDQTLGMVFPPVVTIGYPTLGHAWFTNRPAAVELAKDLGIRTTFDSSTPIAPYGGMFWCRPEAIRAFATHQWRWEDFPDEAGWTDGGLPHVIERLYAYAVMEAGFHTRCVMTADWAEINYTFLEYKLQRVAAMLPAFTQEQVDYLGKINTDGPLLVQIKEAVNTRYPRLSRSLRPGYKVARQAYRLTRSSRHAG
jgi:lipopolysaccharide biosynthesis protein